MKDRLLSKLGLCRKAGKLAHGFSAAAELIKKHGAELVITAKDLSPKTKKEVEFIAAKENIRVISVPVTIDEIEQKTGKRAGVLAVTDKGLAESVISDFTRVNEEE